MPTELNINAPLTLISYGRSGTSLISNIMGMSSDIHFVGETAGLIFFTALGLEVSKDVVDLSHPDFKAKGPECIRQLFLRLFQSEKARWFQKPIGIPEAFNTLFNKTTDEKNIWYWNVLKETFPDALYLTVLRNPIDVAVSSVLYWGYNVPDTMNQLARMAEIITHPLSLISYAVLYDNLVEQPQREISELCRWAHLDYSDDMLKALDVRHVPSTSNIELERATLLAVIEGPELPLMIESVCKMWRRFGHDNVNFREDSEYVKRNIDFLSA